MGEIKKIEVNGIVEEDRESFAILEAHYRSILLAFIVFCGYSEDRITVRISSKADGSVGIVQVFVVEDNKKQRYIAGHRWFHSNGNIKLFPEWRPDLQE